MFSALYSNDISEGKYKINTKSFKMKFISDEKKGFLSDFAKKEDNRTDSEKITDWKKAAKFFSILAIHYSIFIGVGVAIAVSGAVVWWWASADGQYNLFDLKFNDPGYQLLLFGHVMVAFGASFALKGIIGAIIFWYFANKYKKKLKNISNSISIYSDVRAKDTMAFGVRIEF